MANATYPSGISIHPDVVAREKGYAKRSRDKSERARLAADSRIEAARLELEAVEARLEAARVQAEGAALAGQAEVHRLWSAVISDDNAKVGDRLEAARCLADSLGMLRGGARDTGTATAEAVSAVVLESSAIAARAAERDRTRARMLAAGMDAATIAAILGEGEHE